MTNSNKPDLNTFARIMKQAILAAGEPEAILYDVEGFNLVGAVRGNILALENAYGEYCDAEEDVRPKVIRQFVRTWFAIQKEMPDEFVHARYDFLPAIRERYVFEVTPLQTRAEGREVKTTSPYRVLGKHLVASVVYDLPEAMSYLTQEKLDRWGVKFGTALEAGLENLRQRSKERFNRHTRGVWISPWRDNYDASRLLLTDKLRELPVKGEVVVAVPHRDVLIVTGSQDQKGLERMVTLMEEQLQKPRPLCGVPLIFDGDDWQAWQPAPSSPLHSRFKMLLLRFRADEYGSQAKALQALHRRHGKKLFVANYNPAQDGSKLLSYCIWSEGVEAMLPRTEVVVFFRYIEKHPDHGVILARARWERMMEVMGDLLQPIPIYPERYRVREFPTAEQLAELGPWQ